MIPRPDPSVRALLNGGFLQEYATTDPGTPDAGKPKAAKPKPAAAPKAVSPKAESPKEKAPKSELSSLKVNELRRMARGIADFPMTREEIKFAKKDALIKALEKFTGGGTD